MKVSSFYHIQKHTKNLDQELQDELKTKIRRTCKNYSKLKVPYKHQKITDKLSRNTNITILRQDKGRGATILDRKDYIQKCVSILNTSQFRKLGTDPNMSLERKVERTLRKIKHKFEENEYKKLYPTDSIPRLFYGTPKVYKLQEQQQQKRLEELTMRPMISNIGTATYDTAKYLNKLLTPLSKSDYNILNREDLIRRLREETIPAGYKIISFDVKNLFTNAPLDKTIDFILKRSIR